MDIKVLSDRALVIFYDKNYPGGKNPRVMRDYYILNGCRKPWIQDIILCYNSIGVYFDPFKITHEEVIEFIKFYLSKTDAHIENESKELTVPVRYGGEYGPDLDYAAEILGITTEDVIKEHSRVTYTVWGIGFLPGFPYMGTLSSKLILPRKTVPDRVKAGSVAIAGCQTGIYPVDSPGGWYIIGRTILKTFDITKSDPCFFKPGDKVRFIIDN